MVQLLLANGANTNTGFAHSRAPLMLAVNNGRHERVLLQYGAAVGTRDKTGQTPLCLAVKNNDCMMARLLFDEGAAFEIDMNLYETRDHL
ncbi:Ankyrin Repeat, partial [Aspergillus hancockii]